MKDMKNQNGFTIMELIFCIAVVGLLTVSLLSSSASILSGSSQMSGAAAARAIQGAINDRVSANKITGTTPVVPTTLDTVSLGGDTPSAICATGEALADTTNTCFYDLFGVNFLPLGWVKTADTTYQYTYSGGWQNYEYIADETSGYGTFTCVSSSDGSC